MCLSNDILVKLVNAINEKIRPYFIFQFGSSLTNNFHNESDIDLAYLSSKDISTYQNFLFAQELADIAGYSVDLINLKSASTVLKAQIVSKGKTIYNDDSNKRDEFIIKSLKEYVLLNEERQEILEQVKTRGKIYA